MCGQAACQKERRRRNQAAWRGRHPGYFIEWRARTRAAEAEREDVEPPRVPPPLTRLPWALAQAEFGVLGADFLGSLGRVLLAAAKDSMRGQATGNTDKIGRVGVDDAKDSMSG